MELEVERVSLRLREPLRAAWGEVSERELAVVRVREGGHEGVGEAAPLPAYDAGGLEEAVAALRAAAGEASLDAARDALAGGPSAACAALDMAAWDLRGQEAGEPVARLLAGDPLERVPVNALVGAEDPAGAAAQALAAARAGFRTLKVKVGLGDDAARLAAVREAVGPDVALRVDANGAWTPEEAVAALDALAPIGIELCEEPAHGVEALRTVRAATPVAIAMDETARDLAAISSGAADAVCLKVGRLGGISATLEAARAAREAGSDVYLASALDGPVGVAAALHVAAALRVTRPCGLATLALFADLEDPFPPRGGAIAVPGAAGLGLPHYAR